MAVTNQKALVREERVPPAEIRDLMSYADAYSPVADELEALAQFVRHSVTARPQHGRQRSPDDLRSHSHCRKVPARPPRPVRGRHAPRTRTLQETDARGSHAKSNGTSGEGNGQGGQGDGEGGETRAGAPGESGPDDAAVLVTAGSRLPDSANATWDQNRCIDHKVPSFAGVD